MLSERAKELIKKSRIVSFKSWETIRDPEIIAIFQQADNESRYLTDEDIEKAIAFSPDLEPSLKQARLLRDEVTEIVDSARSAVLAAYPKITEPGGGLYPPMRAEACWRDFWHFLRCITYGIAGKSTDYTSTEGLGYMEELYRELQVPLNAMVLGLEKLKVYGLKRFSDREIAELTPYFDRLTSQMKQFSTAN